MAWYENAARLLQAKGVSRAEIGRRLNITGQAVTLKLQGRRPTTVSEAKVFAEFAGVSVAEMLGEEAYLIEVKTEIEMIELFRLLTPKQREDLFAYGRYLLQRDRGEPQS
jgi:transcriptional regulator with XRE-family HTH domain